MAILDLPIHIQEAFTKLTGADGENWLDKAKKRAHKEHSQNYSPPSFGESIFITDVANSDTTFNHSLVGDFEKHASIGDSFRARSGLYWTDATQSETDSDILGYAAKVSSVRPHLALRPYFGIFGKPEPLTGSFMKVKNYIVLEARNRVVDGEQVEWNASDFSEMLTNEIVLNDWYYDHTVSASALPTKREVNELAVGLYTAYADIHGDYNFYMPYYEKTINNRVVSEPTLPNLYVFFAYNESEDPNPDLKRHLSLGGLISIKDHQAMFMPNSRYEQEVGISPSGLYLDEWSRIYGKAISAGQARYLGAKYKNILMPTGDMQMFSSHNSSKELFPMWMNIEFTTDSRTSFAEALKESQLASTFQADLLNAVQNPDTPAPHGLNTIPTFEAETKVRPQSTTSALGATNTISRTRFTSNERRTFDITAWYEDLTSSTGTLSGLFDGYDTVNSTFVGTYNNETKISNDPKYNLFKSLMAMILSSKLRDIVNNQMRGFADMMTGAACQHETVLYRITKHGGNTNTGEPVQTFYLPNSNDIDVYQYIDTQVKYDKEYTYTIYAYELIIGSKYRYTSLETDASYGKYALLCAEVAPSLRLMEIPIHKYTTRVLDEAPVMPDVEFIPFKGINNKIRILLNGSVGRHILMPEIIEASDNAQIKKFRKVQDVPPDAPILYESDDYAESFQIWRSEEKPRSYKDFAGKLRQQVSTDVYPDSIQKATTGAFDDKLKPNKKYYYCIRSVDNHGHISYPTPIYEVEIVDDKGSIYPLIKVVEFAEKIPRQTTRGVKRYMQIVPSLPQTLVNKEKSGIDDIYSVIGKTPILGLPDEVLWGRKFKVRLTSKSTGKKIDFNLQFTHTHIKEDKG